MLDIDPRVRVLIENSVVDVLPQADFIAVRERRRGPILLDEIGVAPERMLVTGDDAIELAYGQRRAQMGTDIGVCLRVAGYSPVSELARQTVGRVVRDMTRQFDAPLAPLIIAECKAQGRRSTLPLVRGCSKLRRPPGRYASPREVAARVARCRITLTGAYHLAVLALSQELAVVALTSSAYYDDVVRSAWREAPELGEPLRVRARDQVAAS